MAQTRIFYATQAVEIDGNVMHGVQSVGLDTTFNLEQAFELGQLSLYENIEGIPEISMTIQKLLDGYPTLWHCSTAKDTEGNQPKDNTLTSRGDTKIPNVKLYINETADTMFSGDASIQTVNCNNMYISNCSYTIPSEGNCTEDVTLVGNDKTWAGSATGPNFGTLTNLDTPIFLATDSKVHVIRGEDVVASSCLIPDSIPGVVGGAGNAGPIDTGVFHVQSFNCSVDLGREQINQLGARQPYNRYVNFPVEVTSSFEVISLQGDLVPADSTVRSNLDDHAITMVVGDVTLSLGSKNKLQSVSYGGGDTGGGNVTNTFSYSNFNDFSVTHSGDPGVVGNGT
ncbi:hypothetical protein OAQ45_00365 [Candidatus Marinimicrobia bacterium]|nr:hypothetical protein [Candidatus Neomarinimicrobiota bacterium]